MRKLNLLLSTAGVLVLLVFLTGFASTQLPKEKLDSLKKEIPTEWWEGGWDKSAQIEEIKSESPSDPSIQAKAQYLIACQHYAGRQHELAIQEFRSIITDYPSAWQECQKAQFEIAQMNLYRLDDPEQAIKEYEYALDNYPKSYISPMAKLGIARSYRRLSKPDLALEVYQALLKTYPENKKEITQANIDVAELYIEQALASGVSDSDRKNKLGEAVSSYKRAYQVCNIEDTELLKQSIDGICRAFRCADMNLVRANSFILFQKYGPEGEDAVSGTKDDLTDPLKDF